MLWSIVEISDDRNLYEKTLNYLLKDFETYYAEPEVRTLVFPEPAPAIINKGP